MKRSKSLAAFLNTQYAYYNQLPFIEFDPISIPHQFSSKQDIEISALFAAIFSWGNRKTIINKANELMGLMWKRPHEFVLTHRPADLKKLSEFKHRTFNYDDLLYFIEFLQFHYSAHDSLEWAFSSHLHKNDPTIENALIGFRNYFFSLPHYLSRTQKHISSPLSNSTCKRLCMLLRWMVRQDKIGVDFGIWKQISPAQLIIPMDVHVVKTAKQLLLLDNDTVDWKAAVRLTEKLRTFDKNDPVKYDYALFGASIMPQQ